jgi:hypothetical protein
MHSGGTSALAGALIGLGLNGSVDPSPSDSQHRMGFNESQTVWPFNDINILGQFGLGWGVGMPGEGDLPEGWLNDERVTVQLANARSVLAAAFPVEPWVMKDPRLCVILPFWRLVDDDAAALLIVRNPRDVVTGLKSDRGIPPDVALSWWEHHMRSAADQSCRHAGNGHRIRRRRGRSRCVVPASRRVAQQNWDPDLG